MPLQTPSHFAHFFLAWFIKDMPGYAEAIKPYLPKVLQRDAAFEPHCVQWDPRKKDVDGKPLCIKKKLFPTAAYRRVNPPSEIDMVVDWTVARLTPIVADAHAKIAPVLGHKFQVLQTKMTAKWEAKVYAMHSQFAAWGILYVYPSWSFFPY